MEATLAVEKADPQAAVQGLLRKLLEQGICEGLLVPMRAPSGMISHALVTDPDLLDQADLFAPVLSVNSATLAGKLTVREPCARLGVVMRACELRALVELVKLQQAHFENVTLIAVDCAGTVSVPAYMQSLANGDSDLAELKRTLFQSAAETPGTPHPAARRACQICEQPVYDGADITIELFGGNLDQEIHIACKDELAERLNLNAGAPNGRADVLAGLLAVRRELLERERSAMRTRLEKEGLPGVFAACIRCHNCMTVCPICYCKTCVFKSAIFDHSPDQYLGWAQSKGACRMPTDTVLFHLTRMNHMVLSCVGCGMCTEACPSELPVGLVFRTTGERLQTTFDYLPGRNVEEPLPLITFQADEWNEVGE